MLVTMFTMHSCTVPNGLEPRHALRHSCKVFWHDFYEQNLPEGHHATRQYGIMKDGVLKGGVPQGLLLVITTEAAPASTSAPGSGAGGAALPAGDKEQ